MDPEWTNGIEQYGQPDFLLLCVKVFKGAQSDLFNFFSNVWRFWYQKKADIFVTTHDKFHSWKVFCLEDTNENVPG